MWIPTSRGRIFHSADKGHTWTASTTPFHPQRAITTLAFHDPQRGMAMSCYLSSFEQTSALVAVTTDGGATWTVRPGPPGSVSSLVAVPGVPGAYIGVVEGDVSSVGSYLTLDDGLTWQTIDEGNPYNGVKFLDRETGWAGLGMASPSANGPAMFKWSGGPVSVAERLVAARAHVVPNPANGSPAWLLLPDLNGPVHATIHDAQGRLIWQQAAAPIIAHRLQLPVEVLAPGAYAVHAQQGAQRFSATLIVE